MENRKSAISQLRYPIRTDWAFYLMVIGYAYLIFKMTFQLWFGEGINIFATYSEAPSASEMLMEANKIYWSKTCFLFLTLLLFGLRFDYRFALGLAAGFWSASLILMFGINPVLISVMILGILLVIQQIWRKNIFSVT